LGKPVGASDAMPGGNFKVCVCGGAGGIGQPLSMLMAMDENVAELAIYDLSFAPVPAEGVAADLSHVERRCKVKAYVLDPNANQKPVDHLAECLGGCHLVLVPAGVPRKPGMDRADFLNINIGIARDIVEACARYCPNAIVGLIVNPVNSVVPAMAELYKQKGLDPKKICGVTTLDGVRANKFVHEVTGAPLSSINVPVVGGHAGATILPLFSQDSVASKIPMSQLEALDKRVQDAGTEVVKAKNGKGSATLSMAYAGAKFGSTVLAGLAGDRRTAYTYVMSSITELPFFTLRATFGPGGVEEVHPIGSITEYEKRRLIEVEKQLKEEISAGLSSLAIPSKL